MERTRRSGATWTALALVTALTAAATWSAGRSVLVATGVVDADERAALAERVGDLGFAYDERGVRTAEAFAALVSVPVAVVLLLLLAGLLRERDWAREAAYGVLGLGGLLLTVLAAGSLTEDPPGPGAVPTLAVGLALLATVALLLTPASRGDAERAALRRAKRQREQAAAARRARGG